jgi:hypothetical protein
MLPGQIFKVHIIIINLTEYANFIIYTNTNAVNTTAQGCNDSTLIDGNLRAQQYPHRGEYATGNITHHNALFSIFKLFS